MNSFFTRWTVCLFWKGDCDADFRELSGAFLHSQTLQRFGVLSNHPILSGKSVHKLYLGAGYSSHMRETDNFYSFTSHFPESPKGLQVEVVWTGTMHYTNSMENVMLIFVKHSLNVTAPSTVSLLFYWMNSVDTVWSWSFMSVPWVEYWKALDLEATACFQRFPGWAVLFLFKESGPIQIV